jgi:hypothetical protein
MLPPQKRWKAGKDGLNKLQNPLRWPQVLEKLHVMNLPSPDNLPATPPATLVEDGDDLVVKTPRTRKQKPKLQPAPTGKIFLGEEDKRLLKKFNSHIVKKLGLASNRSYKV